MIGVGVIDLASVKEPGYSSFKSKVLKDYKPLIYTTQRPIKHAVSTTNRNQSACKLKCCKFEFCLDLGFSKEDLSINDLCRNKILFNTISPDYIRMPSSPTEHRQLTTGTPQELTDLLKTASSLTLKKYYSKSKPLKSQKNISGSVRKNFRYALV
jgi:hypothetical protein